MTTTLVSNDGQFLACKETVESNLQIWNVKTGQNKVFNDPDVTCFGWSPCGTKLAIGNSKGDITILNLNADDDLQKFNGLYSEKVTSLCFLDKGMLASVDSKSNLSVTNIDKNIPKLNFHSSEVFSKLNSPIKQISYVSHPSSSISSLLYIITEKNLSIFNYQSGSISKKMGGLVSVQDPEDICFHSFGTDVVVRCDKQTLLGYSVSKKQKYLPSVSSSIDLISKKRFQTKLSSFSTISNGSTICTEVDGTCHLIKFKEGGKRKKENSGEVEDLVKLKIKVKSNSKKVRKVSSNILFAGYAETTNSVIVVYGSWSSPSFEIFDIDELIARADKSNKNTIVLERGENDDKKVVSEQVSATIQSGKSADFDDIDTRKRKTGLSDMNEKIVTVGDTLEERLEESCKINSATELDDSMDGTSVNAMDKSLTLVQALQANDMGTIDEILLESLKHQEIITTTIKNVAKSFLGDILKILEGKIKSSPQEANIALTWLNSLLRQHPSYMLANSSKTYKSMLKIHELSLQRRKYADCLTRLQGRLSFFLKEDASMTNNQELVNSLQIRANIGEGAITHQNLKPKFVYEADNDEEIRIDASDSEDLSEMDDNEMGFDDVEEEIGDELEDDEMEEEEVVSQKRRKTNEKKAADLLGTPENSDEDAYYPET